MRDGLFSNQGNFLTMLLIGAPTSKVFKRVPSLISHKRTVPSLEAEYTYMITSNQAEVPFSGPFEEFSCAHR